MKHADIDRDGSDIVYRDGLKQSFAKKYHVLVTMYGLPGHRLYRSKLDEMKQLDCGVKHQGLISFYEQRAIAWIS